MHTDNGNENSEPLTPLSFTGVETISRDRSKYSSDVHNSLDESFVPIIVIAYTRH